jgi:predicted nucleotidyltransferase
VTAGRQIADHGSVLIGDLDVDLQALADICRRYGIAELSVFGSHVKGGATPDSDVDLLFVVRPGARLGWRIEQLDDELETLFGHPVDLVSKRTVHPLVRREVLDSARVLYAA